jgi:peptide/nickel transport system substrate-binding protein
MGRLPKMKRIQRSNFFALLTICIFSPLHLSNLNAAPIKSYSESPQLKQLVRKGLLPPVRKRLPQEPLVLTPHERIGEYGGNWYRTMKGTSDIHAYTRVSNEPLLRFALNPKDGIVPNIVKEWKFSNNYKTLRLTIRKGIRWSDGHPFTADDIIFCWEKILLNKNITPSVPACWQPGGTPMKILKINLETVELNFAKPYPKILRLLAFRATQWPLAFERNGLFAPKHYLEPMMKKSYALFEEKAHDLNPERPGLTPWTIDLYKAGSRITAKRNPYFWKVDPEGNQLPYIDSIELEVLFQRQLLLFKAINGEIPMQLRSISFLDTTLLKEFASKGNYRVFAFDSAFQNGIMFNLTYRKDDAYRDLFRKKKFRQAMSMAINKKLVRRLAYRNLAKMPTFSLLKHSPLATTVEHVDRNLRYDLQTARKLLDEIGLDNKDQDGFRTFPNGRPISLILECAGGFSAVEMVREAWSKIGIKASVKPLERTLWHKRVRVNGDHMLTYGTLSDLAFPLLQIQGWYAVVPSGWENDWSKWYLTKGKKGEKPPPKVRQLQQTYERIDATLAISDQRALMTEIVKNHAENVWAIPVVGTYNDTGIVRNDFRNAPLTGLQSWVLYTPGYLHPETFFFTTNKDTK